MSQANKIKKKNREHRYVMENRIQLKKQEAEKQRISANTSNLMVLFSLYILAVKMGMGVEGFEMYNDYLVEMVNEVNSGIITGQQIKRELEGMGYDLSELKIE